MMSTLRSAAFLEWKRPPVLLVFFVSLILAGLTRIPAMPQRINVETTNLAYAMESFDPRLHQPHPTGYPAYVFLARNLAFFLIRPESVFLTLSLITTALSMTALYRIGAAFANPRAGLIAPLLLLVHPVYWFATLQSPTWPPLALFSVLLGWLGWKCWNGDDRFLSFSIVLAAGCGITPEIAIYALPLWVACLLRNDRPRHAMLQGLGAFVAINFTFVYILFVAVERPDELWKLLRTYPFGAPFPSLFLVVSDFGGWVRSLSRVLIWTSLPLAVSVLAAAIGGLRWERVWSSSQARFIGVWAGPAILIHLIGGIQGPGQMLFYVPVLALVAGLLLCRPSDAEPSHGALLAIAGSVLLFGGLIHLPKDTTQPGGLARLRNVMTFANWETSLDHIRWMDQRVDEALWEIGHLPSSERPTFLVTGEPPSNPERALNSRVASYYLRAHEIIVTEEVDGIGHVRRIKGGDVLEYESGRRVVVRVPRNARLVWLSLELVPRVAEKLRVTLVRKHIYYSDLPDDFESLELPGLVLVPA